MKRNLILSVLCAFLAGSFVGGVVGAKLGAKASAWTCGTVGTEVPHLYRFNRYSGVMQVQVAADPPKTGLYWMTVDNTPPR
jgi:uncharacterized membrane protein